MDGFAKRRIDEWMGLGVWELGCRAGGQGLGFRV